MEHGLPLKKREIRTASRKYIKARVNRNKDRGLKSYRQIAQDLSGLVSHHTIRNWMQKDFKEIYSAMAEQNGRPEGGLPDDGGFSSEDLAIAEASDAVQIVINVSRGIKDPGARGDLLDMLRAAATEVEQGGPWTPSEF